MPGSKNNARTAQPRYAVPALDRGLDILEALSASPVPMSLTDVARAVGSTSSGIFRIMARFEERSYVGKDPVSGQYGLTLKLFELSHTHSPVENLLRAAAGPMRELAEAAGESVHLSLIDNGKLVVLLDVGTPGRWRISFDVGARFPVLQTSSGLLLLAHMSEEARTGILCSDADYASMPEEERRGLFAELESLRRDGYAVRRSLERGGLHDITFLTGNPQAGHIAAVAIACMHSGPDEAAYINRLVGGLRVCAAKITAAQGLSSSCDPHSSKTTNPE
jgi:DNA-binding IclR family transcriptional regulator